MTGQTLIPFSPRSIGRRPTIGSKLWYCAVFLAIVPTLAAAQDRPVRPDPNPVLGRATGPDESTDGMLYRDPDPSEGPRVQGPLLSGRPPLQVPSPPPIPSNLGPFQGSAPGTNQPVPASVDEIAPIREPLLVIPPSLPPLPAGVYGQSFPDNAYGTRRSTQIRSPNGILGTFSDWFHEKYLWAKQPYEYGTLPATLLWKPPVANLREPQFYGLFHNIGSKSFIDTAIGAQFGLGRIGPVGKSDPTKQLENEGIQLDIFGAVFTRFDPKRFLTAADYRAGIPLTYKKGPWSTKLSYEHTSTHIGDEYSQAFHVLQKPLVLDEVVFGLSRYFGDHLRLYGQFGYAFNTAKATNANNRTRFDWGISYLNYYDTGPAGRPFAAFDMDIRSYQSYVPNNSLQVGWQWVNHGRSVRLAVQVYQGRNLFGQFYTHNESWVGFGGYYSF